MEEVLNHLTLLSNWVLAFSGFLRDTWGQMIFRRKVILCVDIACPPQHFIAAVLFLRFILSLASCKKCLVIDDQLNILPISSHAATIEALPPQTPVSLCWGPGIWGRLCFLCCSSCGSDRPSPSPLSGRMRVLVLPI